MNVKTIFEWVIGAIVVSATIGIVINAFLTTDQSGWSAQDVVIFGLLSTIVILGVVMMFARSSGLVNVASWPVFLAGSAFDTRAFAVTLAVILAFATAYRFRVTLQRMRDRIEVPSR